MENITKVLEKLGKTASLQSAMVHNSVKLMEKLGVSKPLSIALSQKKLKQIGRLINNKTSLCCFIMVPPDISNFVENSAVRLANKHKLYSQFERSIA